VSEPNLTKVDVSEFINRININDVSMTFMAFTIISGVISAVLWCFNNPYQFVFLGFSILFVITAVISLFKQEK
jgi:hypothetical protein